MTPERIAELRAVADEWVHTGIDDDRSAEWAEVLDEIERLQDRITVEATANEQITARSDRLATRMAALAEENRRRDPKSGSQDNRPCIVLIDRGGPMTFAIAECEGSSWWADDEEITDAVTHWRPLPAPPTA